MKLLFDPKRLIEKVEQMEREGVCEPSGLLAVSPSLMARAEQRAGRAWDGTQLDAERLLSPFIAERI